ncbi:hypothetical protein STAS_26827 [Striga asiatica]|uniref:Uncharacterized protein n=1 Tax=Striga asiatica TaxID=4170 RepID=A0A5A7QWD8_STRAF|nr:hypothetical protein STAS_26827 [Striga asiatica]
MAYRRRQQVASAGDSASSSSASSLAAKAIGASSARRDYSLSSVYEQSALSTPRASTPSSAKDSPTYEHTSKKGVDESKQGFWGFSRKDNSLLDDDDNISEQRETPGGTLPQTSNKSKKSQYHNTYDYPERSPMTDGPALQKGLNAFTSSLNYIGNALECYSASGKSAGRVPHDEGITAVEKLTADIIQETRKIQIKKKSDTSKSQNQFSNLDDLRQPTAQARVQPQMHTNLETQLNASRDVAMAMAAKAKLLLRELKTVKADLVFTKERCGQLEEENRILKESREKGDDPEDDDLIRLQLESLLAEKARLAQENSVYARENRFLREIVEYHQLTMQDVVYLDESNEEVTEVYPVNFATHANFQPSGIIPAHSSASSVSQLTSQYLNPEN